MKRKTKTDIKPFTPAEQEQFIYRMTMLLQQERQRTLQTLAHKTLPGGCSLIRCREFTQECYNRADEIRQAAKKAGCHLTMPDSVVLPFRRVPDRS